MRFFVFKQKLSLPVTVVTALVAVWLLWKVAFAAYWLAGVLLLLGGTCWLVRPELRMLLGERDDRRPWLVRLREHRWRPVGVGGWRLPRVVAYLAAVLLWYLWL